MIQTLSPAIKSSWNSLVVKRGIIGEWICILLLFFCDKLRIIVDFFLFFSNTLNFGQVASRKLIKGIILFTLTHNFWLHIRELWKFENGRWFNRMDGKFNNCWLFRFIVLKWISIYLEDHWNTLPMFQLRAKWWNFSFFFLNSINPVKEIIRSK